jgi:hypothetical protein
MRVPDKALPGDLVIRCRDDRSGVRRLSVWVINHWPDTDAIVAGPYLSYDYALQQARRRLTDRSVWIWRDHANDENQEQLEIVTDDSGVTASTRLRGA